MLLYTTLPLSAPPSGGFSRNTIGKSRVRHGVEAQPPALIGYLRAIDILLLFLTKRIHRLLVSNIV